MNKTYYIISDEANLSKAIDNATKEAKADLLNLGSDIFSEEVKSDINLKQPDFIITNFTEKSVAEEILNLSPQSMVIIVSNDMNRSNNTVTELQAKGYANVTTIDINLVSPQMLVEQMVEMEVKAPEENSLDDLFGEANENELKEIELQTKEGVKTETNDLEPLDDLPELDIETNTEDNIKLETNEKVSEVKKLEKQETNRPMNVNLSNVRTKTITMFSKKGGTGKTFLSKEIANIYSSIKLPKRLANSKEYLTSCVVDLDFERSNLRTTLGISNPSPNIYMWIADILDKLENRVKPEEIFFNRFQVMNYVQKIDKSSGRNFALVAGQGGLPTRTMRRIANLDNEGTLLGKIIKIIIKSIQKVFDIVVLDCESAFSDVSFEALKNSDNIIYVLNNTVSDLENLKVFADEATKMQIDLNKVGLVINKLEKGVHLNNEMLELLSLIKYDDIDFKTGNKISKVFPLVSDMPYDKEVINKINNYEYITNSGSEVKKGILKLCEYCLPIFKVKYTTSGIKELNNLKKAKEKRIAKEALMKEKAMQKQLQAKAKTKEIEQKIKNNKAPSAKIEERPKTTNYETLEEYLKSDLKNVTYEEFVNETARLGARTNESGLPMLRNKPKTISGKVWRRYEKELANDFKRRRKMRA